MNNNLDNKIFKRANSWHGMCVCVCACVCTHTRSKRVHTHAQSSVLCTQWPSAASCYILMFQHMCMCGCAASGIVCEYVCACVYVFEFAPRVICVTLLLEQFNQRYECAWLQCTGVCVLQMKTCVCGWNACGPSLLIFFVVFQADIAVFR